VARLVSMAIAFGWLAYVAASWFLVWNPADAGAYYDAAVRLLNGEPLYLTTNPEAHETYRYAPWFAYAWIPLTAFPRDLVLHAWSLVMLACSVVAVWPIVRLRTPAAITLAALLGSFLVETAMFGNAHPLVVALLVVTAARASFPVALGVSASLKLVPILFSAVWIGRGEWRPAVIAIATAALLWSQALLFDLSGYVTDPGTGLLSVYATSPVLWGVLTLATGLVALYLVARRSRWAWVAVAVLMFVGPPRVVLSYLAFLAPAVMLTLHDDEQHESVRDG
jgi:hypothetical protein